MLHHEILQAVTSLQYEIDMQATFRPHLMISCIQKLLFYLIYRLL